MSIAELSNYFVDVKNDYRINENPFDEGSFGKVYEGWRKEDNLHVAIKNILLQEKNPNVDKQISLIRELQILSSLKHPNCLSLIGFYIGHEVSIITPFMPNGTLEKALNEFNKGKSNKFTATKRMCSLYQICSVMSYLHSLDIIHRDFKPENIFLNENFDIVIADFGLSRIVQENVNLTGNLGSPFYMAPEILNETSYTKAVDVFSFGVTIYNYFLADPLSHVKFDDGKGKIKHVNDFLRRVKNGSRFKKKEEIPEKYYKVYKACVNQNPEARPTFDELAEKFENDEGLLLDGVDEGEYRRCIKKCKKEREKLKNIPAPAPKEVSPKKKKAKIYFE